MNCELRINKLAAAQAILTKAETELKELFGHGHWTLRLDMFFSDLPLDELERYVMEARLMGWDPQKTRCSQSGRIYKYFELADQRPIKDGNSEMTLFYDDGATE